MITTAILGAGFSYTAGLPLTRDLFNTPNLPRSFSENAKQNHQTVLAAWAQWQKTNPAGNAEEWLKEIYDQRPFPVLGTTWENALDFAMARLVVRLGKGSKAPYYHGITTSISDPIHKKFWAKIRKDFDLRYVVTMNYDILVEQGLRDNYSTHRTAPICHYGGMPYHTVVRKLTNATTGAYENVELGQGIALYKMHGSINWTMEPHAFKIHDDVRGAFRTLRSAGAVAIVPPLPEKERPDWLELVWRYAEESLSKSNLWIVCGYSLPDYDVAMRDLLERAAHKGSLLKICVLDPYSASLIDKWKSLSPAGTRVLALPGLPDGLDDIYW